MIKLKLSEDTLAKLKEKQKTPRFLPGETRAAVGADGFKDKRAAAEPYRRALYSNPAPRSLVPPQHLDLMDEVLSTRKHRQLLESKENVMTARCITDFSTTHQLENAVRETKRFLMRTRHEAAKLQSQCLAEDYIIKLHQNLHTAAYTSWSAGKWTWSQATAQCTPKEIRT